MRFCAESRNEADALMVQRDSLPVVAWTDVDRARGFTVVALVLTVGAVAPRVAGVPPVDLHSPFHYLGDHGSRLWRHAGDVPAGLG